MKYPPVHYHEYLQLNQLLGSQKPKSVEYKKSAHDELLFIVVHQTYELWFKQILFELDTVLKTFSAPKIAERDMGQAVQYLDRIVMIQKYINNQIDILETMTPMDFLDFRDMLYPASGFQSFQWRMIETKLGLTDQKRLNYNNEPFWKSLSLDQQSIMQTIIKEKSLIELVESWLERTPFLEQENYSFWQTYEKAVQALLEEDRAAISVNQRLSEPEKQRNLAVIAQIEQTLQALLDPKKYEDLRSQGHFRMSQKALLAALFIQIYRNEPALQMPFELLQALIDLDENMTQWRYRHTLMVGRMLGRKIGTGGSSGSDYLKSATDQHKIFGDLTALATFLIPRSQVPPLPQSLQNLMQYRF